MVRPPQKNLVILVVNYKTTELIEELIRNFLVSIPDNLKVKVSWVMIDALDNIKRSSEGVEWQDRIVERVKGKKMNFYFFQVPNHGFASNVNTGYRLFKNRTGVKLIDDDLLLLINPDSILNWPSVEKSIEFFNENKEAAIAGMSLQDNNGENEKWGYSFNFPTLVGNIFDISRFIRKKPLNEPTEVAWVSGGAMVIKVNWWKKLKGLDDRFFLYFEDVDICKKVRNEEGKVYFLPQATVSHKRGASGINQFKRKEYFYVSEARYFHKYRSHKEYLLLRFLRYPFRVYHFLRTYLAYSYWKDKIVRVKRVIQKEQEENYPNIRHYIQRFFKIELLKETVISSVFVNLVLWGIAGWGFYKLVPPLILHYNAYLGVDFYGDSSNLFIFPALGLFIIIFNFLLGWVLYKAKRYSKLYIVPIGSALAFQIGLAAALINILLINL